MTRVVKFEADWCGPCKAVQAYFDKNGFEVERVNIDTNPEAAMEYKISSIPTVLVLENDQEINRIMGFNMAKLSELVKQA